MSRCYARRNPILRHPRKRLKNNFSARRSVTNVRLNFQQSLAADGVTSLVGTTIRDERASSNFIGKNWTGFYLGLNGGGGWGASDWNGLAVSNSPSGGMFGLTAGYNWQGAGSP